MDHAYGLGVHHSSVDHDALEPALRLLQENGITWIRGDFYRNVCNPVDGKWDFSIPDASVKLSRDYSIKILPILSEVEMSESVFHHMDAWKEYVRRIVSRYADQIDYWEIWNEPNLDHFWKDPDPGRYLQLFRETAAIIRECAPNAKIVLGGLNGIPLGYLEECLKLGLAEEVDILNIHPYEWNSAPEVFHHSYQAMWKLLKKYQWGDRPVWVTETGWSTAFRKPFFPEIVIPAVRSLGIEPENITLAVVVDGKRQFAGGSTMELPGFKAKKFITLDQIDHLKVREFPVLLPCSGEVFPSKFIPALRRYLKRGGTVLLPAGLPFYFDHQIGTAGAAQRIQVADRFIKELHLDWETAWSRPGVPKQEKKQEPAPDFDGLFTPPFLPAGRFLTDRNLQGNDRMIPLVQAEANGYRSCVAAIYRYDSDLKGNAIVCTVLASSETVSPEVQAEYLPRTFLISFADGIDKVFWYNLRAHEWDAEALEAHFGITHKDLSPKPAWFALKTLIELCPDGSTVPKLSNSSGIWTAVWNRPDGSWVRALWSPLGITRYRLDDPYPVEIRDHLGNILRPKNRTLELTGGPIYLVGNEHRK